MSLPTIYLVGDAILDNYSVLDNKEQDLKKELTDLGFIVHNFAIDQTKVTDIINGIVPSERYTKTRNYKYNTQDDGKIYPLKELVALSNTNKSFSPMYNVGFSSFGKSIRPDNMGILSIGGLDINNNRSKIILGAEYFLSCVLTQQFIVDYKKVIATMKSACDYVVLISLYLPYLGIGSSYGMYAPFASSIVNKWCTFVKSIGKEYNIPVLDLSRTLDTGNISHYGGENLDRLSNLSSTCFAKCLQYIYNNYKGYKIYHAPALNVNKMVVEV